MLRFFKGLLGRKVKEPQPEVPYKVEAPVVQQETAPAPAKPKKAKAPAKPKAEKKPVEKKPRAKKAK